MKYIVLMKVGDKWAGGRRLPTCPFLALIICLLAWATPAPSIVIAAPQAAEKAWDGNAPPQGIYFHWYEPSFYTGFAPGSQDPSRVHIELSRGNQVRFTLVLGDAELDHYLDDLAARRAIYQELIDAKVIELTTNKEYERFTEALDRARVADARANRTGSGAEGYRQKSVEIMSLLNPGRIFRIRIGLDRVLAAWHAQLAAADLASDAGRLDAANAILPGRVDLHELKPELVSALGKAAETARAGKAGDPAFRDQALAFLDKATQGRYRVRNGFVDAIEFTAIYPAGTIAATTSYKGETLPQFGVTGVWPLIPRTQGRGLVGMVDYISSNPGYGFITMLPYQHAGGIEYNAFHNAGVRCALDSTPFLPSEWRKAVSSRDGKKPYQNLWMASRGPASHGCTRLGSGHMTELRNSLPASSKTLEQVDTFRNLVQCYDVFDVDGRGSPRVMGVQYYQAFKDSGHTPVAAHVTNKREPFYKWLYGNNIDLAPVGQAKLKEVPTCRFVGKKVQEAQVYKNLPLYEAEWAVESIQFYMLKPAAFDSAKGYEFNRELRKVGTGHTTDRSKLFLK
jgi:hypothetical protein